MKYLETLTYWLINQPVFEKAFYRKEAVDRIRSLSGTILDHLIKVKYIKDEYNTNHWKNEIKSFFYKIDRITIKPRNSKFNKDDYMEWLFVEPYCDSGSLAKNKVYNIRENYIEGKIRYLNSKYRTDIKYEDISFNEIIEFFDKICTELTKDFANIDNTH